MTATTTAQPPPSSAPAAAPVTIGGYARTYLARIRGGDIGALPAVLGLIVLCVVFTALRPVFLTSANFANLFLQGAQITLIAMGLVFVLLVGEIDLSAGFASGLCAAVLAVLLTWHGQPWYVAVAAALGTGALIGLILGTLVAKIGIPSFVVTLAGFLAFQGIMLMAIRGGNIVPVRDDVVLAIVNRNLSPTAGWVFAAVTVGGFAAVQFATQRRRLAEGLTAPPTPVVALRVLTLAAVLGAAVYVLNLERSRTAIVSLKGVPVVVPVIAILLVAGTLLLHRTRFGRHLYAVGGNREAARRAGINVDRIRITAFMICSTMAAIGGIAAASRSNSVDATTGGSEVLLLAVGAAVIGGTSLFGGKGKLVNAVIGGAVVAVINNGMGLMGYSAGVKFAVTGLVLLLAAGVDALSRRRALATGTR
ncbi:ABC transporter permease [Natronosporangium hydrolyticum]|uniref:Xylose transport system permease protein XylH n=1 Tax=Natronosporangium hydrolyticum TaxID=2811111 RepID=A0A895YBU4_9ACTN|nr:ABC transporter permease [Natronosporangium hydrolyticum]QSB13692.1 ABC transporter permease [Natronosporangium hydrolyticum]